MENSVKALFFFSNLQFQRVMNCLAICFGVRFRRQGNALAIGGSATDGVRFLHFEGGSVAVDTAVVARPNSLPCPPSILMKSNAPDELKDAVDTIERTLNELASLYRVQTDTTEEMELRRDDIAHANCQADALCDGPESASFLQHVLDELDEELRTLVRETRREEDERTDELDGRTALRLLFGSDD